MQVPPRGLWGGHGQATWAPAEHWLGARLDAQPRVDALVLRYLAAFGPATVADIRTWSGLTGLREVVARLRPQLRTFRDERGRELLDVPDAPLPDPDTPAPPRLLPEYDNLLARRTPTARACSPASGPGCRCPRAARGFGSLLADGFFRAFWQVAETAAGATLDDRPLHATARRGRRAARRDRRARRAACSRSCRPHAAAHGCASSRRP